MVLAAISLILQTDRLVVVDKPASWLSVPSRAGGADPRPCVGKVLEKQLGQRLWPTHRLDFEVTGLLLFAKDAAAHSIINQWFEQRLIGKTYEALTEGEMPENDSPFIWTSLLLRGKKRAFESPHGKPSETLALAQQLISTADGPCIFWRLEPRTGRPHQLRFELSKHGFPILGDRLYGAQKEAPVTLAGVAKQHKVLESMAAPGAIALRCTALDFTHCVGALSLGLPESLSALSLPGYLGL